MKKNISVVCVSKRDQENYLYWLQFTSFLFPNQKTFTPLKDQSNNLYHEDNTETKHHEEMQFSAHYPNTVVGQFYVEIENEILCHETRMSAFIFLFS